MIELWGEAVSALESQDSATYRAKSGSPITCVSLTEGKLVLRAPNRYQKEWFEDNCLPAILEFLVARAGHDLTVEFVVGPDDSNGHPPERAAAGDQGPPLVRPTPTPHAGGSRSRAPGSAPATTPPRPPLKPRYTFDEFVVGPPNRFAHSAAMMAAEAPGEKWNPLFIYGGVGVGKTHLLHAIGHAIAARRPEAVIVSVTCERFVTEFIGSIMNQNRSGGQNLMEVFRNRYRQVPDVLLIDDIQFLSGKDSSQDEFFHTFNVLHDAHKQIVLTCDKLPAEVHSLEERLKSRFTWGLIAEMGLPDLETRVAILKRKAEAERIVLPDDVALHVGHAVRSNVRDLEGALARLSARATFESRPITLDLAREALKNFLPSAASGLTIEGIQREVANYFNVKLADLRGPRRHRAISHPRAIAMYLSRTLTSMSFPEIGSRFGGKDHSTVITAVRKIDTKMKDDAALRSIVKTIESHLQDV